MLCISAKYKYNYNQEKGKKKLLSVESCRLFICHIIIILKYRNINPGNVAPYRLSLPEEKNAEGGGGGVGDTESVSAISFANTFPEKQEEQRGNWAGKTAPKLGTSAHISHQLRLLTLANTCAQIKSGN